MVLIELCVVLLIILQLTPVGDPVRDRFGMTGVVVIVAAAGGLMYWFSHWGSEWFVGVLFKPGESLASRRRMHKDETSKLRRERELDALDDGALRAWIDKRPRDALAVEMLCERLKLAGEFEGYARERGYFLSLENGLTAEEKASLYHELADLYLGPLGQPVLAQEALLTITKEMPRSYQATLARQRLRELGDRERDNAASPASFEASRSESNPDE
jgi:hypothetical protein